MARILASYCESRSLIESDSRLRSAATLDNWDNCWENSASVMASAPSRRPCGSGARRPRALSTGHASRSLDHLIRPLEERRRGGQAEGLGGLEVDDQFELGGLLDGEIGGLGASQ